MIAGKWFDMIVGVDIHIVMVPTPAGPVPTPLPHPFAGLVYDPGGLLVGTAISLGVAAFTGTFAGPVLINNLPCANTGTEGTNKMIMPHIPTPPGTAWAPIPAAPKPPVPGKPPDPPAPTPAPSNDTVLITGSKTVHIGGTNGCRLGDLSMDCAEPVRLPNATLIAVPMGPPVLVGGPPALDLLAAALGAIRTKWMTGMLRRLTGAADGSWRSKLICMLTGHPVDVVSGMVLTDATDFELPGPIPFKFERTYYSKGANQNGPLGHGWSHGYDQRLRVETGRIVLESGDGRELYFQNVAPGTSTTNHSEEMILARTADEIRIRDRDLLTYVFMPARGAPAVWPLVAIEDPRGNRITFGYDERGRLSRAMDAAGRTITFVNDEQGRLTNVRLPHPQHGGQSFDVVRFEYDVHGDLVAAYDALGHAMRYAYKHHLLVQETAANDLSFYFAYDGITPDARCVRTWGDGGIFDHVLSYDPKQKVTVKEDSNGARTIYFANDAQLVEKMIDSLGRERTFAYDDALHQVTETNARGDALAMEFDRRGNLTSIADGDGVARSWQFDRDRQPIHESIGDLQEYRHRYNRYAELEDTANAVGGGVAIEFSERGDPVRFRSRSGRTAELVWDEQRNLIQATLPGEAPTRAHYDGLGRVVGLDLPGGDTVRFELDLNGRPTAITRSWLGTDRFEYGPAGLLLRHIDAGGGELDYEYTNYNRIAAMHSPAGGTRRFEYDTEGDLVAIVNEKGEVYRIERDSEGQVVREVDFAGRSKRYRLDEAGNIAEIQDDDGQRTKLEWSAGGRIAGIEFPDGCYDKFTYDSAGRLTEAENENGVLAREYDGAGRLTAETWHEFRVEHAYDIDNLLVRTRTSDGHEFGYEYDVGERLTRVTVDSTHAVTRSYDGAGRLAQVRTPGGIVQAFGYDDNGNPRLQRVTNARGQVVAQRRYEFNAAGALAGVHDPARGLKTFAFGAKGLERVFRDGEVAEAFHYDAAGELLPADAPGTLGPGGRVDRFGDVGYEYDRRGRVISRTTGSGTWSYAYNDRDQLTEVRDPDGRTTHYRYDPFWRRVESECGDEIVRWSWNGDTPVREERGNGSEPRTFVFEPDGYLPLLIVSDDDVLSVIGDQNGTPQEIVSRAGRVVWAGDYNAWGTLRRRCEAGFANPLRFPGQWHDSESGLHYNRFRYYDPETGRYLTPDPIGLRGGLKLYAYPTDPVTWMDPLGLAGCARNPDDVRLSFRQFMSSYAVFFRSGIRPKHARAIMREAIASGETYAFRNIGSFGKRMGSFVAGLFGMRPKPMSTKAKSNALGIATDEATGARFRSDYDPAFYRNADGSVMSDAEAAAANNNLNNAMGGEEIQHPTHVTMPEEIAPKVGPPTESTVFNPDGTTSQMTPDEMRDSPGMPWMWD